METKKGKLTYIANGGARGIRLNNDKSVWYNPTDECKDLVKEDLLNQLVEITMVGNKNYFKNIKVVFEEEESKEEKGSQTKYIKPLYNYDRNIAKQNAAHAYSRLHTGSKPSPQEAAKWCKEFVNELYKE